MGNLQSLPLRGEGAERSEADEVELPLCAGGTDETSSPCAPEVQAKRRISAEDVEAKAERLWVCFGGCWANPDGYPMFCVAAANPVEP